MAAWANFIAAVVVASWNEEGKVVGVGLSGGARVQHTRGTIAADRIEAIAVGRRGDHRRFRLDGRRGVRRLETRRRVARLRRAPCDDRCQGRGARRARHRKRSIRRRRDRRRGGRGPRHVARTGRRRDSAAPGSDRRAHLSSGRTRIVADTIVSDLRGVKLEASGRVESTMLPASANQPARTSPMFTSGQPVHFVSASLLQREIRRAPRAPRRRQGVAGRAHAVGGRGRDDPGGRGVERLRPRRDAHAARSGACRDAKPITSRSARTDSPIEAPRARPSTTETSGCGRPKAGCRRRELVATLADGRPRAARGPGPLRGSLRIPHARAIAAFRRRPRGTAIARSTTRWRASFASSATRRPRPCAAPDPSGGTTVGRVLRYDVDTGALEVESGERDRATIQTPKN